MIILEFGTAENQSLTQNSMFIKFPKGSTTFWEDKDKIKNFWNSTYLKDAKEWEVPYTEEILAEIQTLFNNDIYYLNERPRRKADAELTKLLEEHDWGKFKPYPYQLEGIKYGLRHRSWILGDTMGLGKSYQTIQLANIYKKDNKIKHCLVVCCINSLKYNWLNEIGKFTKDRKSVV